MRTRDRACAAAFLLLALPQVAAALPLISELFYDATGSDDGKSFVELYGTPGTLLDDFRIEGVNGSNGDVTPTLVLSGVIPSQGSKRVRIGVVPMIEGEPTGSDPWPMNEGMIGL